MSEYPPLSVLVVEDQALLAMELQYLIEDAGHSVAGWATCFAEAANIIGPGRAPPDLAFVDIHLADGVTGTTIAAHLQTRGVAVVYMTANAKRIPDDFAGAVGVMAKPYTSTSVLAALDFLHGGVRNPPPSLALPAGLRLSPRYAESWATH